MEWEEIFPFLVLVTGLIVDYLIAREFYRIAVMKGHDKKKYLWLAFFFSIIGYLLVIALPIEPSKLTSAPTNCDLPDL